MPNGMMPWKETYFGQRMAPWEQTWLGKFFQPKISATEQRALQKQVTPYAKGVLGEAGMPSRITPTQWAGMQREQPPMPTPAPKEEPTPEPEAPAWMGAPPFPTQKPPAGYEWVFNAQAGLTGAYVLRPLAKPTPVPTGLTPAEKERFRLEQEEAEAEEAWRQEQLEQQEWQRGQAEATRAWQEQQAAQAGTQWQQQFEQAQMQAQRQYEMQQQQWGQQMQWSQQQAQMQQEEAERRERARLSAQPMSWLQYAAYTGEQPAIQPWMQPLMQGQYQAGQAIPDITSESMAGMPQLTTPSAQLWGRMGPTAQQQYAGYRQARTGVRPEETAFRMGAGAPPGGRSPGLKWTR